MTDLRQIKPFPLAGSDLPGPVGPAPTIEWVRPSDLVIEERYQRNFSERSAALIRKIIREWDWAAFKLPSCSRLDDGRLAVVDGQHTATAAASHPDIESIPVLVSTTAALEGRAGAFIRHNRDRVAMTPMQIHHAAVAAGDEVAVALEEAAAKAGARILRWPKTTGLRVGDTMAVTTLSSICRDRGVHFTARLLKILVDAQLAPIDAASIRAVEQLLTDPAWKDTFDGEAMSLTIASKTIEEWVTYAEIHVRKGMRMPLAKALAIVWWQRVKKRRATA